MIVPAGVKVHLALGYTDMRKGTDGLAMLLQETLKNDPFCGHGNGLCLVRSERVAQVLIRLVDPNQPRSTLGASAAIASRGEIWSR